LAFAGASFGEVHVRFAVGTLRWDQWARGPNSVGMQTAVPERRQR